MTDKELERKLAQALERAAPDDLEGVLSRCGTGKGTVIEMKQTKNRTWKSLIAACLALALVGGGGGIFYQQSHAVASVVSLDVNPSIELKVNKKEMVLSCVGLNDQAAQVLTDYNNGDDLEGIKLKVAVNALVGSMVSRGYLNDLTSAILISVEDKDQQRAARLQQELTASVDVTLQESAAQAAVLSQTVSRDEALEQQAQANNISTGKAALVNRVIALNSALAFDKLSALSVEELKDLAEIGAPGMPVDKSQAAQDVLKYAGLDGQEAGVVASTVDPELDDRVPHYEVDLYYNNREYEYIVDAFTGAILSGTKDVPSTLTHLPNQPLDTITQEKALDIAAADFYKRYQELTGSNLLNQRMTLDTDDNTLHYDVEFFVGGYEVDYEINAVTGAILDWDTDYEGNYHHNDPHHDDPHHTATQPNPQPQPAPSTGSGDIGGDKAKSIALNHSGLSEGQVTRLHVERDMDDGRLEYEVDFKSGGMEYEYTIDGSTGAILEHEKDRDD